ncbi:uncharacterized protein ARMOST_22641 [Armillaria ostoyae]|uniref:Uncharacterized protein n=1 Tax=Armillaria ostoyae TaxID=47428 RepID=A0A284SDE6_ARMOS|nr:uncharacterized protein ARMOST_22641 [Armillaria ostoyae]
MTPRGLTLFPSCYLLITEHYASIPQGFLCMVHASDTNPLPLDLIFSDVDFFFQAGTEMYKISSPLQPSQIPHLHNSSQTSSQRSGRVERYSSQVSQPSQLPIGCDCLHTM